MRSTSVPGPRRSAVATSIAGLDAADVDQLRARDDAARAHLLGVAREAERLLDLRARDEGALALAAVDALLGLEALQHVADGRPGDAVLGAELALGGQGRAPGRLADQLEQRLAQRGATSSLARTPECARFEPRRSLPLSRPHVPPHHNRNLTIPITICNDRAAYWVVTARRATMVRVPGSQDGRGRGRRAGARSQLSPRALPRDSAAHARAAASGTVVFANTSSVQKLDPDVVTNFLDFQALGLIYDTLVTVQRQARSSRPISRRAGSSERQQDAHLQLRKSVDVHRTARSSRRRTSWPRSIASRIRRPPTPPPRSSRPVTKIVPGRDLRREAPALAPGHVGAQRPHHAQPRDAVDQGDRRGNAREDARRDGALPVRRAGRRATRSRSRRTRPTGAAR